MNELNDLPKILNAGEIIYIENTKSQKLYLVKKGEVRLMRLINNHLQVFQICSAGDIINDVSVLTNQPTDHIAIVNSFAEIVEVDAKDIRQVISKCPKWVPEIFNTLCDRLKDSQDIIYEHNLKSGPIDQKFMISKNEETILLERIAQFKN